MRYVKTGGLSSKPPSAFNRLKIVQQDINSQHDKTHLCSCPVLKHLLGRLPCIVKLFAIIHSLLLRRNLYWCSSSGSGSSSKPVLRFLYLNRRSPNRAARLRAPSAVVKRNGDMELAFAAFVRVQRPGIGAGCVHRLRIIGQVLRLAVP